MDQAALLDVFRQSGALLEGHFRLSSGLHSGSYLQCALVLQHPRHAERLGQALADRVRGLRPDVILSPALGGIIIGYEVARALGIRSLFVERSDGQLALRRGFHLTSGERVIIVEDVVTTGESTRETIEVGTRAGARVVGVAAIVHRAETHVDFSLPYVSLGRFALPAYTPDECPLCSQGLPLTKPGSRKN